jgi:hypothetical protein
MSIEFEFFPINEPDFNQEPKFSEKFLVYTSPMINQGNKRIYYPFVYGCDLEVTHSEEVPRPLRKIFDKETAKTRLRTWEFRGFLGTEISPFSFPNTDVLRLKQNYGLDKNIGYLDLGAFWFLKKYFQQCPNPDTSFEDFDEDLCKVYLRIHPVNHEYVRLKKSISAIPICKEKAIRPSSELVELLKEENRSVSIIEAMRFLDPTELNPTKVNQSLESLVKLGILKKDPEGNYVHFRN